MNFEKGEVVIGLLICLEVFAPKEQLSITLQRSYNSAADVRHAVAVVLSMLRSIRNEDHYNLLWSKMETFVADYDLKMPKTPRQRRVPRQLEFDIGLTGAKGHGISVTDLHRRIYFEVLDLIVTQIEHRFCQPI